MSTKKPNLVKLDHYRSMDAVPQGLIEQLELVLKAAKAGKLVECLMSYQIDTGTELNEGGQFMWRNDGRLDALHSECHVMAHRALQALLEDDTP